MKNYNGAIDDCSEAIKLDGNYGFAYLNRGNAKEMLRDENGSCSDWKKAAELGVAAGKGYASECK